MKKIALATLILMSACPADAGAPSKAGCYACGSKRSLQPQRGFYVKAEVGGSFRNSKFKDSGVGSGITTYTTGRVRPAQVWGAAAGYKFNERLRVGVNVQYMSAQYIGIPADSIYGGGIRKQKIKSLAAFLGGSLDLIKKNIFTPYVTASVGVARNTGNLIAPGQLPNASFIAKSKGKANMAWGVGGGIRMKVCTKIDLDLMYRYTDLGKISTKSTITTEGMEGPVDPATQKLRSNQVVLGIIYNI